jgi:hypothetical protein
MWSEVVQMMVCSAALTASGPRRLSSVQWNRDGCHGFDVLASEDVPTLHEGMIRRALLRGALVCKDIDELNDVLNRQLWQIGYMASVQPDPVSRSILIEVSKSLS